MKLHRMNGFTLIELLMVVAIISILAAIAIPNYNNSVIKASREAAQSELMELASLQEKIYLNSNAYTASVTIAYNGNATTGGLGRASGQTTDGKYNLSLDILVPSQTFTLTATPVAGKKQAGNGCLTIREDSRREWHENNDACNTAAPTPW